MTDQTSSIPNGWKMTKLGSVLQPKGYIRGPFGSALKRSEMKVSGIPVYEQQNVIYNHRTFRYFIDENKYHEMARFTVKPQDILISCSGTLGKITVIGSDDPIGIISQALLILRSDTNKIDITFLSNFLNSVVGQHKLMGASHGSVQINIAKRSEVEGIELLLPPISEQHAISSVLSSLDNKIELLREQNRTLESIAQTIFKEWFLNFNFPGSTGKMIDSELGQMPEGWRVGKYSDLVEVITGKGIRKEDLQDNGEYQVLGANGEIGRTNKYLFDEDLILTGRVGTLGTIFFSKGKVWISDNALISKPLADSNYYYAYFQLKRLNFDSLNRGSTQPLITQTDLKNVKLILPKDKVLMKWHEFSSGLFNKVFYNNFQMKTLYFFRDTLLPKLMKGEIRVKGVSN